MHTGASPVPPAGIWVAGEVPEALGTEEGPSGLRQGQAAPGSQRVSSVARSRFPARQGLLQRAVVEPGAR